MGLFSKTIDYNLILENVLEEKKFSANIKSLLLSMIYKIETSYSDYMKVKKIAKTKDAFLSEIISNVAEYFEMVKIVEPDSKEAKILRKYNVLAITNEAEKSVLAYPTESSLLYAISDIKPKYYYIENYIFKKELQELLVEGNNLNTLEVLEDFTGWSWNPKSSIDKNYIANIVYQNLIMMFGLEYLDNCRNSQTTDYDIVNALRKNCKEYYNNLTEVIYLKCKNKKLEKILQKKVLELKDFSDIEKLTEKTNAKKDALNKKIEKIDNLLNNESSLKKSFVLKNTKLPDDKKIKDIKSYIKILEKEKKNILNQLEELKKYQNQKSLNSYKQKYDLYKGLLDSKKTLEEAFIDLQMSFIKILYKKSNEIKSREEFIDLIYKIRYYRNIFVSKNKSIKDFNILESSLNKIYRKLITSGTQKAYMRMMSYNILLNAKIIIGCLDSKSMELENLKASVDILRNTFLIEVFENKIFEKRFNFESKIENPDLTVKRKKPVRVFI